MDDIPFFPTENQEAVQVSSLTSLLSSWPSKRVSRFVEGKAVCSQNQGYLLEGPYNKDNKDYRLFGSILGSPTFGNYHTEFAK